MSTVFDQMKPYARAADDSGDYVKLGSRDAEYEHGVLYQGPWEMHADGFSEHVRRNARALSMASVPVHLRTMGQMKAARSQQDEDLRRDLAKLSLASIARYAVQIQQVVPVPGLLSQLVLGSRYCDAEQVRSINARRAIYTVWERTIGVAQSDVDALNKCGQAWVACRANKNLLADAGVAHEKLRVVPCPFFDDDPLLPLASRTRRKGPVRFYHIGKWEPRKAQDKLVLAFMRAFEPNETILLLKTSPASPKYEAYPATCDLALLAALEDDRVKRNGWTVENVKRSVLVISQMVSDEQILELHRMSDVYVSLSRGEGFDMPAFDAKLAGNMLVYTPSGGAQDFADGHDLMVLHWGVVPTDGFYGWPPSARYLDYDVDVAAQVLKDAKRVVEAGRQPCPWPKAASFSAQAVGAIMRRNIEELCGGAPWGETK